MTVDLNLSETQEVRTQFVHLAKDMYIKYKDKEYNLEQLLDNIFGRLNKLEELEFVEGGEDW